MPPFDGAPANRQYVKTGVSRVCRVCGCHTPEGGSARWSDRRQGVRRLVRVASRSCRGGWRCRLGRGEAASAHRHAVPVEDGADRPSVDAEPGTQFVHGRTCLVAGDEFLDLVGVELPCPSGFRSVDGRWGRCGGVGELPEQCLQGFYLRACVVVGSPKVHR